MDVGDDAALAPHVVEWASLAVELELAFQLLDLNMAGNMPIKGVEFLGDMMRREKERAQARIDSATERATAAFAKFNGGVDDVDGLVEAVESEAREVEKLASELAAQLGNSPPPAAVSNGSGHVGTEQKSGTELIDAITPENLPGTVTTENPPEPQS